jgi:hypothetical protein
MPKNCRLKGESDETILYARVSIVRVPKQIEETHATNGE